MGFLNVENKRKDIMELLFWQLLSNKVSLHHENQFLTVQ